MANDLSRLSGKSFAYVIRDQTAKVLETALRYTPIAKVGQVTKEVTAKHNTFSKVSGPSSRDLPWISTTKSGGRKWWVTGKKEGKYVFQFVGNRWPDAMWDEFEATEKLRKEKLKIAIRLAKQARGLARQVWLQAARDLRLAIKYSPAQVATAMPSDGKRYDNADGREFSNGSLYYTEISVHYSVITPDRAARILQSAVTSRIKAFEIETRKGVFADIEQRAKRYPGIFTK
jgi:hypothetical protein